MFPIWFGGSPFGDDTVPIALTALEKRLQGHGGYSNDDDSNRVRELYAWAIGAAVGKVALERASAQGFVSLATELLEEWEHELALPNDAARTILQRQERLIAIERAGAGAAAANVVAAIARIASVSPTLLANTLTHITQDGAESDLIFQVALKLASADFDNPVVRRAAAQLIARLLPARSYGQHGVPDPESVIIVETGAKWGSANHQLDRDAIGQQTGSSYPNYWPPARTRSYGPLSKLRAADLNALQDNVLFGPANGIDANMTSFAGVAAGQDMVVFGLNVAALTAVTLDTSIDWRDRFIICRGKLSAAGKKIQPGGADEAELNASTEVQGLLYTGDGNDPNYNFNLSGDMSLRFSSGDLKIQNIHATNEYSAVLMLIASQDLGKR